MPRGSRRRRQARALLLLHLHPLHVLLPSLRRRFTPAAVAAAVAIQGGGGRDEILRAGVLDDVEIVPNERGWEGGRKEGREGGK